MDGDSETTGSPQSHSLGSLLSNSRQEERSRSQLHQGKKNIVFHAFDQFIIDQPELTGSDDRSSLHSQYSLMKREEMRKRYKLGSAHTQQTNDNENSQTIGISNERSFQEASLSEQPNTIKVCVICTHAKIQRILCYNGSSKKVGGVFYDATKECLMVFEEKPVRESLSVIQKSKLHK
ncbi:hypothetical protein DSO57_1004130 [Entomophthora muscae]|uniref:Uncharacterized protein n=1 Tax=Entomophthora muscae TaxID=34485 RepID=A0ACC2TIY6_9FUNG|nr:hypothetical protein DSO57_1004130 [Entomophthora muscae]